jgi:hypothetical protein
MFEVVHESFVAIPAERACFSASGLQKNQACRSSRRNPRGEGLFLRRPWNAESRWYESRRNPRGEGFFLRLRLLELRPGYLKNQVAILAERASFSDLSPTSCLSIAIPAERASFSDLRLSCLARPQSPRRGLLFFKLRHTDRARWSEQGRHIEVELAIPAERASFSDMQIALGCVFGVKNAFLTSRFGAKFYFFLTWLSGRGKLLVDGSQREVSPRCRWLLLRRARSDLQLFCWVSVFFILDAPSW